MKYDPILIVNGEPNSIFFEILFKTLKKIKIKSPLVLIGSYNLLKFQMDHFKFRYKVKLIDKQKILHEKINKNVINLINVDYKFSNKLKKISKNSKNYIDTCFGIALELLNKNFTKKFINGPISKNKYLNKKYLGITEFLVKKTKTKKYAMIIFNKKLSVAPITTHLPLKKVSKKITKKIIIEKIRLIHDFYKKNLKIKPKIAITGLNPHCESNDKFNEEQKIIIPSIKYLRKRGFDASGPFSADTLFLKNIRKKFNIIVGMYHDQVLGPMKTIFEFKAINITAGLPFIRISPDHGPNEKMLGKNISNPESLMKAIKFLDY